MWVFSLWFGSLGLLRMCLSHPPNANHLVRCNMKFIWFQSHFTYCWITAMMCICMNNQTTLFCSLPSIIIVMLWFLHIKPELKIGLFVLLLLSVLFVVKCRKMVKVISLFILFYLWIGLITLFLRAVYNATWLLKTSFSAAEWTKLNLTLWKECSEWTSSSELLWQLMCVFVSQPGTCGCVVRGGGQEEAVDLKSPPSLSHPAGASSCSSG